MNHLRNRIRDGSVGARGAAGIPGGGAGVIIYVNTSGGSDANSGLTPTAAKLSIDGARTALNALGGIGTIKVSALEASPVQGFADFSSGRVTIEPTDGATTWHMQRVTTINDGSWSSVGGGIYTHTSTSSSALWYVQTLADGNGFQTILTQNVGTPTTPAAGEFGYSGSTLYVHLPGDANPNTGNGGSPHIFKRANTNYLIRVSGTGNVTVRGCVARYGNGSLFETTAAGARLNLIGCTGQYANGNGLSASAGLVYCENTTMQRSQNDGFNVSASSIVVLTNCDGSYNLDEGASNHNTSTMTCTGGRYHHNGHGGMTVVDTGVMNLDGVLVDFNGATGPSQGERGGINYVTNSSGVCMGCTSRNNTGEGFNCTSGGVVTVTGLTSGLAQGNTLADVTC